MKGSPSAPYAPGEIQIWVWFTPENEKDLPRLQLGMEVEIEVEAGVFPGIVDERKGHPAG